MKNFQTIKLAQCKSLCFFTVFAVVYILLYKMQQYSSAIICCWLANSSKEIISLFFRTINCSVASARRWKQSLSALHRGALITSIGLPLGDSSREQNQWAVQQVRGDKPQTSQQAGKAPSFLLITFFWVTEQDFSSPIGSSWRSNVFTPRSPRLSWETATRNCLCARRKIFTQLVLAGQGLAVGQRVGHLLPSALPPESWADLLQQG